MYYGLCLCGLLGTGCITGILNLFALYTAESLFVYVYYTLQLKGSHGHQVQANKPSMMTVSLPESISPTTWTTPEASTHYLN